MKSSPHTLRSVIVGTVLSVICAGAIHAAVVYYRQAKAMEHAIDTLGAQCRVRRLSDSEDPGVLRPVYFERIDFLGADITGKQERVVRSKSKPSPKRSGGQASDIL
jgi:hypothetical protein